jgi:O-antigen/teichoic acid export membrane protein
MAATFALSPLIAQFFDEPRVTEILRVLSVIFVVTTYGSIQEAVIVKQLDFRKRFIPQFARTFSKGAISISLAFMGYGVWSLVWGQVGSTVLVGAIYFIMTRWKPQLIFDARLGRQLMGYGSQLILLGFLSAIVRNIDYIFIGRFMDSSQLGIYTLAYRLPELVIISLVIVVGQALFPAYTKIQNDDEKLRHGFLVMIRYMSLITFPLGMGMLIVAPEFVHVFYTEKWAAAIPVMQVLAIYAAITTLNFNVGDIYKATGRPYLLNIISIIRIGIAIPLLWIAASGTLSGTEFTLNPVPGIDAMAWFTTSGSILYVAYAQLVINILITLISLGLACYILKTSVVAVAKAIVPATVNVLAMLGGTLLIRLALDGIPDVAMIAALTVSGAVIYLVMLWITGRELLLQILGFVRPNRSKRPQSVSVATDAPGI